MLPHLGETTILEREIDPEITLFFAATTISNSKAAVWRLRLRSSRPRGHRRDSFYVKTQIVTYGTDFKTPNKVLNTTDWR